MTMEAIRLRSGVTSGEVARVLAQAPEGATLCLSPETYSFGMEGVLRGVFAPSNNNTTRFSPVSLLDGAKTPRNTPSMPREQVSGERRSVTTSPEVAPERSRIVSMLISSPRAAEFPRRRWTFGCAYM